MTELSYHAELVAHYRGVKNRLWKPRHATRMVLAKPAPKPVHVAPKPHKSLTGAILSLREMELLEPIKLGTIMEAVCQVTGVPQPSITTPCRVPKVAQARQIFFWIARNYTRTSQPKIARYCRLNGSSSVFHAIKKINADMPRWQTRIDAATALLGELGR